MLFSALCQLFFEGVLIPMFLIIGVEDRAQRGLWIRGADIWPSGGMTRFSNLVKPQRSL